MKKFDFDTEAAKRYLVPIHPDGWMFVACFAIAALVLGALMTPFLYLGLLATVWCIYFFRDPQRVSPKGDALVLSAADGLVDAVEAVTPPQELGIGTDSHTRISVRLSLMDVHVNRVPVAGTAVTMKYHHGKFLNASLDKAHEENERQYIGIKTATGTMVGVVQIAGLISRRIVCRLKENQAVTAGERFGIIRFGSRVDVYIPATATIRIVIGQRVVAGETVLAELIAST